MTTSFPFQMQTVSERFHLVYYAGSGLLAHIHQVITLQGGTETPPGEADKMALQMAARHGHEIDRLRVLRVAQFDGRVAQRVNIRTGALEPLGEAVKKRTSRKAASRTPKRRTR